MHHPTGKALVAHLYIVVSPRHLNRASDFAADQAVDHREPRSA
jgi:hypothetical protein